MGYYGTFDCDVHIAADKVTLAEKALAASEDWAKDFTINGKGDLSDYIGGWFYEADSYYKEASPLEQLAGAATEVPIKGEYFLSGHSHQKWRSQERVVEIIAPFVTKGSFIEITGEEGERVRLEFNGESMHENWAKTLFEEDLLPLESAEEALKEIVALYKSSGEEMPGRVTEIIKHHRADLL